MNYVARKQSKFSWKLIALLFVVLLVIGGALYQNLKPKLVKQGVTICSYDVNKSSNKLSSTYEETFEVNDFLYYGESLNLFANTYTPGKIDKISGATLVLKNICNDQESFFTANPLLDQQISLDELEPGYYELFINDLNDLKKKKISI